MSERNTTTITLDEEIDEWRQRECNNFSALVNDLVKQYIEGGQQTDLIRKYRKREIEAEIEMLEAKKAAQEELLAELEEAAEVNQTALENAREALSLTDIEQRGQKFQFWRDKVGVDDDDEFAAILKGEQEP